MRAAAWGLAALIAAWGLIALIVAVAALAAIGERVRPTTYADDAREATTDCLAAPGTAGWRASSGVSAADWCRAVGTVRARRELCADRPESC